MAKTCRARIEEHGGLAMYRELVNKIIPLVDIGVLRDPTEYADSVDGDPDQINLRKYALGKDAETENLYAMYDNIAKTLDSGGAALDREWKGDSADQFLTDYLPRLVKHINAVAAGCKAHHDAANLIAQRVGKAQGDVYAEVDSMITWTLSTAAGGVVGAVVAAIFSAGVGGAAVGGTAILAIATELLLFHIKLESIVDGFNTDLENVHLGDLRELAEETFVADSTGLAKSELTKDGWVPE